MVCAPLATASDHEVIDKFNGRAFWHGPTIGLEMHRQHMLFLLLILEK